MKFYLTLIILLAMSVPVMAGGTFTVTEAQYIIVSGNTSDTLGREMITPDSIRIVVTDSALTELFDAWFEPADAQCALNGDVIAFADQWEDINGAGSTGVFSLHVTIASDADNNIDLFSNQSYVIIGVDESVEATFNEIGWILDSLQAQDGWVAQETSLLTTADNIGINWGDVSNPGATVNLAATTVGALTGGVNVTLISGDAAAAESLKAALDGGIPTLSEQLQEIVDTLQAQDDWVAQEATLAYFDTLIYVGSQGLGIYLDSAAANTNTVLGTDGTPMNPVSTLVAARTLSDALGIKRYYFINRSTFNAAANDFAAAHQNFDMIGIGHQNAFAFGGQQFTGSHIHNMDVSGMLHASGQHVLYTNVIFGYITGNFAGHAYNSILTDTIVVKTGQSLEFFNCASGVAGDNTPTIDFSSGSSTAGIRNYSGGIRIMNGASNDTVSIETDGQVIIASNNTSLNITIRGMLTPTDNGTTTNLTKDAVFSRQEADLWVWANVDTANTIDTSLVGEWLASGVGGGSSNWTDAQRDSVLANMEDGAITAAKFDAAAITATVIATNAIGASEIATDAIGSLELAANAITSAEFAPSAIDEIVDGVWDEDSTGHYTSPNMAFVASQTSASFTLGDVADTVWQHGIRADTTDGAVDDTSAADHLYSASLGGAGAWSTAQRDSVLRNMEDRAISLVKLDSAFLAALTEGIWLDDGAANTNTTVGIDGTVSNPVSTLAAARILADSQGLQKYYLTNNSSFTLAATHEDWEFIGTTEGNLINFGSQDVDGSVFEHLMISGTQGGTGVVGLHECYLNTIDSLEAIVINSSYSDTISLRASTNTVFDQCYSHIAGDASPGLDFNSAGTTINVDVRHYSGGLTLFNGTSDHTISYESDGQLIIDASCTSLNVTARGNMTITNNGTTTSLTDYAVFNVNAVAEYPEYLYKMVVNGTPTTSAFTVASIAPSPATEANDFCVGMQIRAIDDDGDFGNTNSEAQVIADFAIADSTFTVRPGFMSAPNIGDTVFILPARSAVEPNPWTNHEIAVTATGEVRADTVLRPPQTMVASDTVVTGDTIAVKKDSLIYQGAAGALSAAGVWNYEGISDFEDSTGNDQAGQYLFSVGLHNVSQNAPTVQMKLGSGYDGTTGSNVEDDFDSLFADVAAINGGAGNRLCSLFFYNSNWIPNGGSPAITNGRAKMTSGATVYETGISGDGFAVFNVDDATWTILATSGRYTQDTIPQTIVITAAVKDTVTMTPFSPSSPSDTGKVVLYVYTDSTLGGKFSGATFRVIPVPRGKSWVTGGNRVLPLGELRKTTDSNGYAEIEVYQSSFTHPYPSGSDSLKYNISITYPGLSSWGQFNFVAPDSGDQYQIGVIE